MVRFAANLTTLFTERPMLERFALAAEAGFDAVEVLFPYAHPAAEIAAALRRHDLTLALLNMPPGDWAAGERGFAALPDRRAAFEASLAQALAYAEVTGAQRLHMMAGLAPAASREGRAAFCDSARRAADAARPAGIDILIEPINPRDMPGYFLNDFAVAAALLAEIDRPNVRLQFDIYHRQIVHGDVIRGLEMLMPWIGHVQVAAVPGRHEPGTGELDDFALFRTLDALGYAGVVGCEYNPQAGTHAGLGWLARARGGAG